MSFLLPSTTPVAHLLWIDSNHSMARGWFTFLGRVRSWNGLLALVCVLASIPISSVVDP